MNNSFTEMRKYREHFHLCAAAQIFTRKADFIAIGNALRTIDRLRVATRNFPHPHPKTIAQLKLTEKGW